MQWTDRIRQVKILLVAAAVLIAVASLIVSHFLTRDLSKEERARMEVWAQAMKSLSQADENTDLSLVLRVLNDNNTIPVVVTDRDGVVTDFRNVRVSGKDYADSLRYLTHMAERLQASGRCIRISLSEQVKSDYMNVCYDDSLMLKRLAWYPFIQLGVVMIFVVVAIFALLTSKRAEQNKVWVGLSKETAHQLGTPISSLMAWQEILKESYPEDPLVAEMGKDVERLQLIADRFSKIGSLPEPVPSSLNDVIDHVIDYMDRRTSRKVSMVKELPKEDIVVSLNASLFEWVIENLCKNAVDAMGGGQGTITIHVEETETKAILDVTDTGKGIRKKDIGNVFRPGFTTKKRGWGLGLSLAKRIVEEYQTKNQRIVYKKIENKGIARARPSVSSCGSRKQPRKRPTDAPHPPKPPQGAALWPPRGEEIPFFNCKLLIIGKMFVPLHPDYGLRLPPHRSEKLGLWPHGADAELGRRLLRGDRRTRGEEGKPVREDRHRSHLAGRLSPRLPHHGHGDSQLRPLPGRHGVAHRGPGAHGG